jgi:lysophospholipase L1-like esterase
MKYDRVFCFGDSITLGCNDSSGLGWPGRLGRGLMHGDTHVAIYNLGINGDTAQHIATRWRAEAEARSRNAVGLMLFAFGFNDASRADGGDLQVDLASSIAAATSIFIEAKSTSEVLWIGPTPLDERVNPLQTEYASWETLNTDLARYDEAYAALAGELQIDYLRLFPEFLHSDRYHAALGAGDGIHPGDDGYAQIAQRIASWLSKLEIF